MLLKDLNWTSRLGMSSCTVREPMTLQAEHLGIRFYPYPLVYAIGGHAKPSQRRERVEETQTAPLYILRESENDLKWPKKFSKRKISGVQISSSNYLGWCGSPLSNRGAGLWESWQKSRVRWKLEFCGQVLDVENQCHLALWWMEVMMSLGLLTVPHVQGADSVAARKFSFDWIFKVLVYLAKLFLWQQDGSNVVPCVVATLYIFVGWWHWGGWRPCKPMHTERTCAPKNLGMGPELSDVLPGRDQVLWRWGTVFSTVFARRPKSILTGEYIVEVCGESGIPGSFTLDDYAWQSRVFVAIYCNFLLPILDMSIIIKNTRSVALEGQSVKSKFHLSLMISQIRLTNCRLPAAASQVWRTKFRVQGPQRLSRLTENYKVRFCKLSKCRVT